MADNERRLYIDCILSVTFKEIKDEGEFSHETTVTERSMC